MCHHNISHYPKLVIKFYNFFRDQSHVLTWQRLFIDFVKISNNAIETRLKLSFEVSNSIRKPIVWLSDSCSHFSKNKSKIYYCVSCFVLKLCIFNRILQTKQWKTFFNHRKCKYEMKTSENCTTDFFSYSVSSIREMVA